MHPNSPPHPTCASLSSKFLSLPCKHSDWRRPACKSSEPVLQGSFSAGRARHRSIQFAAAPGIRNAIYLQFAKITNLLCVTRMAEPYVNAPSRGATLGAFICGLFSADAPKINMYQFIKLIQQSLRPLRWCLC